MSRSPGLSLRLHLSEAPPSKPLAGWRGRTIQRAVLQARAQQAAPSPLPSPPHQQTPVSTAVPGPKTVEDVQTGLCPFGAQCEGWGVINPQTVLPIRGGKTLTQGQETQGAGEQVRRGGQSRPQGCGGHLSRGQGQMQEEALEYLRTDAAAKGAACAKALGQLEEREQDEVEMAAGGRSGRACRELGFSAEWGGALGRF